jgi:hypothetical protein
MIISYNIKGIVSRDFVVIFLDIYEVRNMTWLGYFFNFNAVFKLELKNKIIAGNYQLIDKESTGRIVVPPGITSSGTRIPQEERDYQLIDERNPREE